jgi:hypothetical protein
LILEARPFAISPSFGKRNGKIIQAAIKSIPAGRFAKLKILLKIEEEPLLTDL